MRANFSREFESVKSIVAQHRSFVITTHINPDGDGLGCECALRAFLTARGKEALVVNHSKIPPNYSFLDPSGRFLEYDRKTHLPLIDSAGVIFILDANHPDRLGSMKDDVLKSRATKICIDHHPEPDPFADLYLLDEASSAAGEIVYRMLTFIDDRSITPEVAKGLYAAIMTDTGSFRFSKTDAEVHRIVARLINAGADPSDIYTSVFDEGTPNRLRLLGNVLSTLRLSHDGKVASFVVTRQMFQDTGTTEMDTDAFIPYTLTMKGVQIGLMFTELGDAIKISLRSRGEVAINGLAREFGGNGHRNAAGALVRNGKLDDVIAKVISRSSAYIDKVPS